MASLQFSPATDFSIAELARLFTAGFEGYLVPVAVGPELLARIIRRDGTDLSRSLVARRDSEPVGLAMIAPRFERVRLAGMGIVPSARRTGVGRALLTEFLTRAKAEAFEEAWLEVFEQNLPALSLYRSAGFAAVQRLFGFTREPMPPAEAGELREVSLRSYVEALKLEKVQLPWVQSPEQATAIALPNRAWTLDGDCMAVFAAPAAVGPIGLTGLYTRPEARRQGRARRLLHTIQARYPGRSWGIPQVSPESMAPFFEALGFARSELNQFEMRLMLDR